MSNFSIGHIATTSGIPASTIRYYERIGLLPAPRRKGGRRIYSEEVFDRLRIVRLCKELGFELPEVKIVLDGLTRGDRSVQRLRKLSAEKLPKIEEAIARARVMQSLLRSASRCACPTLEVCARRAEDAGVLSC